MMAMLRMGDVSRKSLVVSRWMATRFPRSGRDYRELAARVQTAVAAMLAMLALIRLRESAARRRNLAQARGDRLA